MVVITRKKIEDHLSPTTEKFWDCRTYTQCGPILHVLQYTREYLTMILGYAFDISSYVSKKTMNIVGHPARSSFKGI